MWPFAALALGPEHRPRLVVRSPLPGVPEPERGKPPVPRLGLRLGVRLGCIVIPGEISIKYTRIPEV